MAHLRPLWIVAGGRIRIGERDDVTQAGSGRCIWVAFVEQGDCGLLLETLWFNGVAEIGVIFLPRYPEGQRGKEVIDY